MSVDRYTKLVLTVIAVCLVWISLGGPSLITPVKAQTADRVLLAGWVDAKGAVLQFPPAPTQSDTTASFSKPYPQIPRVVYPLPMAEWYPH
jgi:hypothetical protein